MESSPTDLATSQALAEQSERELANHLSFFSGNAEIVDYQDYHEQRSAHMEMFNPPHPGQLVRAVMGKDLSVSVLEKHLKMSRANLSKLLNGRMSISPLVAMKLSETFPKQDARFWLGLQSQYDLAKVRQMKRAKLKPLRPEAELAKAA